MLTLIQMSNLSDEDYVRSELFKHMKAQYADVINRVNNLEALNVQLREEAKTLQAERTAFREKIEHEVQAPMADLEHKLARADTDLTRIRAARDELGADVAMRKAAAEREQAIIDQVKELAAAREDRIKAMESELERLRLRTGEQALEPLNADNLSGLSLEEVITRYKTLEKEYSLLNNELPSMGAAWKKASALASKKVMDTVAMEEKVVRLQAEKSKADQKYFSTMKLNESREVEVRSLRAMNKKSAELIEQMKEVETSTRQLMLNLERQIAETSDGLTSLANQNRNLQQQITQHTITVGGLRRQVNELTASIRQKDTALASVSKSQHQLETEAEQLRVRLTETEKAVENWKSRAAGKNTIEEENLRVSGSSHALPQVLTPESQNVVFCNVCRSRMRNTVLKTCGHVFCKHCIDQCIAFRARRCPNCSKQFGGGDLMTVHM